MSVVSHLGSCLAVISIFVDGKPYVINPEPNDFQTFNPNYSDYSGMWLMGVNDIEMVPGFLIQTKYLVKVV